MNTIANTITLVCIVVILGISLGFCIASATTGYSLNCTTFSCINGICRERRAYCWSSEFRDAPTVARPTATGVVYPTDTPTQTATPATPEPTIAPYPPIEITPTAVNPYPWW